MEGFGAQRAVTVCSTFRSLPLPTQASNLRLWFQVLRLLHDPSPRAEHVVPRTQLTQGGFPRGVGNRCAESGQAKHPLGFRRRLTAFGV